MSKNKAATAHGEVEYETVTCDSCGIEVVESDAVEFQIGEDLDKRYSRDVHISGYACRHCADVGPAGFPERSLSQRVVENPLFQLAIIDRDFGGVHPIKAMFWAVGGLTLLVVGLELLGALL